MGILTFKGGIHPPYAKALTEHLAIEKAPDPQVVVIALQQHIGAPCEPLVKKGDSVEVGQRIGEPVSFISAPVHSSVSGIVKDVVSKEILGGTTVCVVIESDGLGTVHQSVQPKGNLDSLTGTAILGIIRDAGIVGMGGAGFPTHVKLAPPLEKTIDVVILNGAECEPYLTADHRLMLEEPEKVIFGLKAIMKTLNVTKGYVGIENNKPDAIERMRAAVKPGDAVEIVGLCTKYPQGAERQLIKAVSGREVPSGGLPMDVGAVVNNVATAAAIADAIRTGMPLVERICTVTGKGVVSPKNLRIKIGTSIKALIEQCGGYQGIPGKVILGGPMMGIALHTDDMPATKTTSGLLVLTPEEAETPEPENCMRCARCADICPVFLQPLTISAYALKDRFDMAAKYHAMDCIECGSCSYICPARRPLLQSIRLAKREILADRRKSK